MRHAWLTLSPQRKSNKVRIITPYSENDVLVYWLWGQSNMMGAANNYNFLAAKYKALLPVYVNRNPSHNSGGSIQFLQAGVNHQSSPSVTATHGPILSFGYEMGLQPVKVCFIHHSVGGTRLKTASGTDWNPASSLELWEQLMRDTSVAWGQLQSMGLNPIAKGIHQFQGETDALDDTESPGTGSYTSDASAYSGYLADLNSFYSSTFTRWTGTYGIDVSQVKICIARIANYYEEPTRIHRDSIRQAQMDFCAASPSNRAWFSVDDLGPTTDGSHLSSASQIIVGERAANYFKQFI